MAKDGQDKRGEGAFGAMRYEVVGIGEILEL